MSVGTGTALAIGLGANAGLGALGAKKASSAAKDAAKTQQASADKAMAFQTQMMQQALDAQRQQYAATQQLYAPYANSSPASLAALHEFVGLPGAEQSQTMVPYNAYGPSMRPPFLGQPGAGGPPPGMQPGMPGMPPPGAGGPGMMMKPPGMSAMGSQLPGMLGGPQLPNTRSYGGGGMTVPRRPMPMSQLYQG